MIRHILVALDGSEGSIKALKTAMDYVTRAQTPKVTLVSVLPIAGGTFPLGFTQEVGIGKEYFEVLETRIQEQLEKAKTLLSGLPAEISTHVLSGNPGDEIVAFAKENGVEMILIGSRGRRRLRSHLLGSVSDRVAHHANCNVWVVH